MLSVWTSLNFGSNEALSNFSFFLDFHSDKCKLTPFLYCHSFIVYRSRLKHTENASDLNCTSRSKFYWIKCALYLCGTFLAFNFDIYLEVMQRYTDIHKVKFENYKILLNFKIFIDPRQEGLDDHDL